MIAAAEVLALARRFLPAVLLGLLLATRMQLVDTRRALANERTERTADRDRAERHSAEQERGFATALADALGDQAKRFAAREPLIIHSTNTVRDYAQTDAGRARCLGADRVRELDAFRAALAGTDAVATSDRPRPVSAGADPAPAGR